MKTFCHTFLFDATIQAAAQTENGCLSSKVGGELICACLTTEIGQMVDLKQQVGHVENLLYVSAQRFSHKSSEIGSKLEELVE